MPQRIGYGPMDDLGNFIEEDWMQGLMLPPPGPSTPLPIETAPPADPWMPPTVPDAPPMIPTPPQTPPTFQPLPPLPPGGTVPQPVATSTAGAGTTAPPNATTPPPPPPFEGFDFAREQNPQKSAKDAFAQLAKSAPPPPINDKAALGQWFSQYIAPGMNALGHTVNWVDGDKFEFSNWQGTFVVDFGRGAGAPGGALAWQADTPGNFAAGSFDVGGGGGGGAAGAGGSGGSGAGGNFNDFLSLLQSLGGQFGGPGDPGIGVGPVQQVGQDPFSQAITGALMSLMGNQGSTGDGQDIMSELMKIIQSGGDMPGEDTTLSQFESARELMAKAERTMTNDARAALASRGLLGEPGAPSGQEAGSIRRITENIAPEFARAVRDILIEDQRTRQNRLMQSLQLATGMAQSQAQTLLNTARTATERQQILSDIALRTLAQNQAWSMFLAEFGLSRDQALQEIQSGNIAALLPLMQMFLQTAGLSRGGFV